MQEAHKLLKKKILLKFVNKNFKLLHYIIKEFIYNSSINPGYNLTNHLFNYRYVTVELILPSPPPFLSNLFVTKSTTSPLPLRALLNG